MGRSAQAGAIAVKAGEATAKVLLVNAKQDPSAWIFPKGHIEEGESGEAAAIRELREEAGIAGESLGYIGTLEFDSCAEPVRVDYYLVRFVSEVGRGEGRRRRWYNFDKALETLTFADARRILQHAKPVIEQRMRT